VRAGGVGLLGACDVVVAGPRSTFAITEARLGLAAAVISVSVLPRIDARSASRYYLTGATFDAAEAQRIGLVTLAADDVDAALATLTADLLKASPQGLIESKRIANRGVREAIERYGDEMVDLSARLFASEEAHEGMTHSSIDAPALDRLIQTGTSRGHNPRGDQRSVGISAVLNRRSRREPGGCPPAGPPLGIAAPSAQAADHIGSGHAGRGSTLCRRRDHR